MLCNLPWTGYDMRDSPNNTQPTVSIIMPTYNRERFLPEAFESIQSQTFTNWELIVVDDGSTDGTKELVHELAVSLRQPVRYFLQENQGAYAARNTGLELLTGRYVAFFDSDDIWLSHHLKDCVEALDAHGDVDWVYGACRIVGMESDHVVSPSTFRLNGDPRPFTTLRAKQDGRLRIIDDERVIEFHIRHGLYCGLQNSVIRATVFDSFRFHTAFYNEAEDQIFPIQAILAGHRLAYYDNVHVVYRIHASNSSAVGDHKALESLVRVHVGLIRGYERLLTESRLSRNERRALKRRLSREYFWNLGYSLYWQRGNADNAIACYRRGIAFNPMNPMQWKTLAIATIKRQLTSWGIAC